MNALTSRQLLLLVALTLAWGLNWPVMKLGVSGYLVKPVAPMALLMTVRPVVERTYSARVRVC